MRKWILFMGVILGLVGPFWTYSWAIYSEGGIYLNEMIFGLEVGFIGLYLILFAETVLKNKESDYEL